jgi:hypothetical protein
VGTLMDVTVNNTTTVHGVAAIFVAIGVVLAFVVFIAVSTAIFVGPLVGFRMLAIRWFKNAVKHHQDMVQFAAAKGWGYVEVDDRQTMRWRRPPFGHGLNQHASNVVFGTFNGHPFFAFDYTYEVQGDKSTVTSTYGVCALDLPAEVPYLEVGPESALSRLESVVGVHDVEIESEDFNRKFRVRTEDAKFASDVLSASLAQTLLKAPAYQWRTENLSLVSWHQDPIKPAELDQWLGTLSAIVDAVPEFVWHEYPAAPAAPDAVAAPQPAPAPAPPPAPAPAPQPAAVGYVMARPLVSSILPGDDILPGRAR